MNMLNEVLSNHASALSPKERELLKAATLALGEFVR